MRDALELSIDQWHHTVHRVRSAAAQRGQRLGDLLRRLLEHSRGAKRVANHQTTNSAALRARSSRLLVWFQGSPARTYGSPPQMGNMCCERPSSPLIPHAPSLDSSPARRRVVAFPHLSGAGPSLARGAARVHARGRARPRRHRPNRSPRVCRRHPLRVDGTRTPRTHRPPGRGALPGSVRVQRRAHCFQASRWTRPRRPMARTQPTQP